MGIEVSTYIAGLTATWPPSGDPKSQGDDHLRLIKGVLQTTFPNASKPFYFPSSVSVAGPTATVLTAAQDKSTVYYTTAGGDATVTLPSGLAAADAGWSVEVVKSDIAANGVMVVPASGTILTQFGGVASVRIGSVCSPVRFVWGGTGWFSYRHGPLIGSTINFDGPIPFGYLVLDGSTFVAATFAELYLAMGSVNVLCDKRGRTEAGVDAGAGRLTATYFGTAPVLKAVGGGESLSLTLAQLPTGITVANASQAINVTSAASGVPQNAVPFSGQRTDGAGTGIVGPGGGSTAVVVGQLASSGTNSISATSNNTSGQAHRTCQPTIVTNKIIRAC